MFVRAGKTKAEKGLGKNEADALLIICRDHLEKKREHLP
jgi:hypothetical protein